MLYDEMRPRGIFMEDRKFKLGISIAFKFRIKVYYSADRLIIICLLTKIQCGYT